MLVYSNRRFDEQRSRALNLISRYIFREVFASTAIVAAVLLLIFMSNQFAETLGDAAADALPRGAVIRVLGLQFIQTLALLSPVSLLLGILLAMARLNRDSEMTALAACGIGPMQLLRPISLLALALAGSVGWLALFKAPVAISEIETIRYQAQAEMELGALTPGRFTSVDGGDTVVYAVEADGDSLYGVFIEREEDGRIVVIVAEEGQRVTSADTGASMLVLFNGKRYVGTPGEAQFSIEEFAEHGIPVELDATEFVEIIEARSTASLLASTDVESRAELAWRLSVPISILALALLAVPLGRAAPREGRYARFGVGILIYIIYANTLLMARVWIERQVVPEWLGLWSVHGVLILLASIMLMRQSGFSLSEPAKPGARIEPVN